MAETDAGLQDLTQGLGHRASTKSAGDPARSFLRSALALGQNGTSRYSSGCFEGQAWASRRRRVRLCARQLEPDAGVLADAAGEHAFHVPRHACHAGALVRVENQHALAELQLVHDKSELARAHACTPARQACCPTSQTSSLAKRTSLLLRPGSGPGPPAHPGLGPAWPRRARRFLGSENVSSVRTPRQADTNCCNCHCPTARSRCSPSTGCCSHR